MENPVYLQFAEIGCEIPVASYNLCFQFYNSEMQNMTDKYVKNRLIDQALICIPKIIIGEKMCYKFGQEKLAAHAHFLIVHKKLH